MYSNSSSFLGGAQSSRPGAPAYGQASFSDVSQQPNGFAQQPNGYTSGSMQPQATGFPGQSQSQSFQGPSLLPAYTGYPTQNQQSFQATIPQRQPPQQPLSTQATGRTSSQIAQSFQSSASAPPLSNKAAPSVKIPKIRLSFLTAQDQAKFEQLFKSAVGDGQALDGMTEVLLDP